MLFFQSMQGGASRLGTDKISSLLLRYSLPAVIGTVVFASMNIVNTIFIGKGVGSIALTAISLSFPVFAIFMAVGMLVGIGSSALISIRLGEGRTEEAEKVLAGALTLFFTFALVTTALGLLFLDPILRGLGASDQSLPYARDYLRIIILGVFVNYLAMGMNNPIRASGRPGIAMVTLIIGALINVPLNALFVFHFHMGVKGSALATVIGSSVSAAWVMLHFTIGKSAIRLKVRHLGFHRAVMAPALFIGLAPCLMQVSASLVAAASNHQLARYGGDLAVGAIAIINSIAMMFLMPIIGINQGVQPVIGFNYGARFYHRVRAAWRQAVGVATVFAASGCILIHVFPEGLISLFSRQDPALHDIAVPGLKIFLSFFFVVGFQAVSANYFQATGKPRAAIVLNLLRQVILFIPALFILPRFFGLTGIWLSAPASDLLAAAITFAVVWREYQFLKRSGAAAVKS